MENKIKYSHTSYLHFIDRTHNAVKYNEVAIHQSSKRKPMLCRTTYILSN